MLLTLIIAGDFFENRLVFDLRSFHACLIYRGNGHYYDIYLLVDYTCYRPAAHLVTLLIV